MILIRSREMNENSEVGNVLIIFSILFIYIYFTFYILFLFYLFYFIFFLQIQNTEIQRFNTSIC
jgi:hypothetical protein